MLFPDDELLKVIEGATCVNQNKNFVDSYKKDDLMELPVLQNVVNINSTGIQNNLKDVLIIDSQENQTLNNKEPDVVGEEGVTQKKATLENGIGN